MVNPLFQIIQPINIAVKLLQEVVLLRGITGGFAHVIFSLLYKRHKDVFVLQCWPSVEILLLGNKQYPHNAHAEK